MLGKDEKQYYKLVLKGIEPKDKSLTAVFKIIENVNDRRGLRQEFEQIDDDIQEEIVDCWVGLKTPLLSIFKLFCCITTTHNP